MTGIPIPVIERHACTGGTRLLVTGDDGEALYLGRSRRLFSAAQKKILIHSTHGQIEIRKWDGDLWFVRTRWRGDPKPEHRRQPGPLADPDLSRLRPKRDPDP